MAEQNVNATSGNKKVLIGPRRFSRMNSPKHGSEGKTLFPVPRPAGLAAQRGPD
jgi:hypothetical protein